MSGIERMFILDVQGFQYGTENFLCKEIAILDTDNNCYSHRFVKMPVHMTYFMNNFQTGMNHITQNIHGLKWENEDNLEYERLSEYIINCIGLNGTVHVKGLQKKKWLEKFMPNITIIDLETEGCPSFNNLKLYLKSNHCKKHLFNNDLRCSVENVYFLWYWYNHCRNICNT